MQRRLALPHRLVVIAALALGAVWCLAHVAAGRAATTSCPSTFTVEHDDRVGALSLPQGPYTIRVTGLSCATASQLFTQFLNDWDGRLPGGWKPVAQKPGQGSFTGPRGQSFAVQRSGGTGGGGNGLVCAQRFVLAQNDRIGPLVIKKGRYIIDRLGPLSPTCTQAAALLQQFLQDFDGILPGGWVLLPADGTFVRGSASYGFRLEPDPHQGGGGQRYPTQTTRCGASFRVLHNDAVGALRFPAGSYWVSIYKGSNITCGQASQLFAAFLARPDGSLPSPWAISVATGSFRRGARSLYGFVAKPAFNVASRG